MIPLWPLVAAAFVYIIYYIVSFYRMVAKYPRGPFPFPLVGNFFQLHPSIIDKDLEELAKVHGSVFTIFLPQPIVIITEYEALKEAFVVKGDDFAGRPIAPFDRDFHFCDNQGVINSNGGSWRENRRQAISILRDFGMGKGLMEEKVKISIGEYLRYLEGIKDKSNIDMRWPIQLMVANIINETLFGVRYAYDDCDPLMNYVDSFNKLIRELSTSFLRFVGLKFPWIKHVPILGYYAMHRFRPYIIAINAYIRTQVNRAMTEYKEDEEPECFVHAYRQRMRSSEYLTHEQLLGTCSDFFAAGQETTTTTLRWAMLLLAANQDVQDKLREEVLAVVGRDRMPSMADKSKMPYTVASVMELQRCANILQMNVMRRTLADTSVMGHKIPADTFVNGDIHQVMACDPLFEHPEQFLPDRYLAEDGRTFIKDLADRTVPFSIGKRQCAGEGLARVELFLGLAATVQNYRILPSAESGPIDLKPVPYIILLPRDQKIRLEAVAA